MQSENKCERIFTIIVTVISTAYPTEEWSGAYLQLLSLGWSQGFYSWIDLLTYDENNERKITLES